MHLAMIIDAERLAQEQLLLNRVGVGLMSEGVQLTRIVPESFSSESLDEGEQRIALANRLAAPMRVLPWLRKARLKPLAEVLERSPPDVLYAVGASAWELAHDLAQALQKPLLLDIHSLAEVRGAGRWRSRPAVSGFIAACAGLEAQMKAQVDRTLVTMVPMGVVAPAQMREPQPGAEVTRTLAVLGAGRDVQAYAALFGALQEFAEDHSSIQVFLELRGPHEHEIWRIAERLDLLRFTSAVAHAAHYRGLVTRCDLVLIPERSGELRSILLEAMALGLPVIARHDPALDMLRHDDTALVVQRGEPGAWVESLKLLINDRERGRAIGHKAREVIVNHHRSSKHVASLLEALERCRAGGAYSFGASSAQVH